MDDNPSNNFQGTKKEKLPIISLKKDETNQGDNIIHDHQIEPLNLSTRRDPSEDDIKVYEENGKIHVFQRSKSNINEIYYCDCCNKIMNQGSIYQPEKKIPVVKNRSARFRFTDDQIKILKLEFKNKEVIDREHRLQLSEKLRIPEKQIMFWWQNERARLKKKK